MLRAQAFLRPSSTSAAPGSAADSVVSTLSWLSSWQSQHICRQMHELAQDPGELHASQRSADVQPQPALHTRHLQQHHASSALILDGRSAAAAWTDTLALEAARVSAAIGRPPGLAVIQVGERPDSLLYVARKQEACERIGIAASVHRLSVGISQETLEGVVAGVCADEAVDGVLVQLPLPRHLDEEGVMGALDPRKDVDGFHPLNMGRMLMRGRTSRFVPCTPLGVMELLERCNLDVRGCKAVVLGDSNVVGTPMSVLLRDPWCSCSDSLPPAGSDELPRAQQLPDITRTADVLVVAVGHPELVRANWVKPGAVVIDIGINIVPDHTTRSLQEGGEGSKHAGAANPGLHGLLQNWQQHHRGQQHGALSGYRVVGDVAFQEVAQVASAITPVPGGVGPLTIAAVLANTLRAAEYNAGLAPW